MDIGLLDQDAICSPETFIPNLEIMKLSTYYKKNKNYVSLILNPDNIERYTRIILRKDNLDSNYLSNVLLEKKCDYGGLAFTNNRYISLEEEIENCTPDLSIYNNYFNKILSKQKKGLKKIEDFQVASFIRLSSNQKNCDLNAEKGLIGDTRRSILIYDQDIFNIDSSLERLSSLIQTSKQKVKFVYEQSSTDFNQISNWCKQKFFKADNKLFYNKIIYNKEFKEICDNSHDFHLRPLLLMATDKNQTYTLNFLKNDFKNSLNRTLYIMISGAKVRLDYKDPIKDSNFNSLYKNLKLWERKGFGKYSFKDYLLSKGMIKSFKFLNNLAESDSALRELINVAPSKIRNKGGKWLL